MRTPNAECCVCAKPLYRRPFELKKVRYVACLEHRNEAQALFPLTESQKKALELGREKGTNHLEGIPKSASHREKIKGIMKEWCANNKKEVAERAKKNRGKRHYKWKGGITKLNVSIRRMTENRKWMNAVKERDGKCVFCGSINELEADHIKPLAEIIHNNNITNRDEARACSYLWDVSNGRTLCKKCHCKKDKRKYTKNGNGRRKVVQQNAA